MRVEVDDRSGFCFGVVNAISKAEEYLAADGAFTGLSAVSAADGVAEPLGRASIRPPCEVKSVRAVLAAPSFFGDTVTSPVSRHRSGEPALTSLGDIVHNGAEMARLEALGLEVAPEYADLAALAGRTVLIRAHGEPPGTYENALRYGIALIDATCPVVARLQKTVARAHVAMSRVGGQVVIFGRRGHAEVRGLAGQAGGDVLVVENEADLDSLDFTRPIYFLAQTTSSLSEFRRLGDLIKQRAASAAVPGASGGIAEPVGRASIPPLGQVKSVRAVLAAPSFFGDTATSPIPGHCAAGEESANRRSLGVSERGDVNFSHRHREDDVVQGDADSEAKAAPPAAAVTVHDTICRQVSGREEHLAGFARRFDVVLFVSGAKSSNGRVLFEAVRAANPRSHKIENASELRPEWFDGGRRAGGGSGLREISVGVCGATSTPRWLMEHVAGEVEKIAE